jgi:ABC-type nitrate/sulfonate/bicarbonate transport system permease component
MADKPKDKAAVAAPKVGVIAASADVVVPRTGHSTRGRSLFALRREVPLWQRLLYGVLCVALAGALWWFLTREDANGERIVDAYTLPSPAEAFAEFPSLWYKRALTRNTVASLTRVGLGFALAAAIGIPLGILCGCFPWFNAFLAPLTIFGRNIPVAALIPLTFAFFGIGELQKIMFIFIAAVAFIVIDTARAINDVGDRYIDTAYTLGASRWQIIRKVLVPLALPSIFNSLRLLFGLAFGYIMLAEVVNFGFEASGLGNIISVSQRLGPREHIYLVLLIIPLVALGIDRLLYWIQRQLFPHQYGSDGMLHALVRAIAHGLEDLKGLVIRPKKLEATEAAVPSSSGKR